MIPGFYDGIDFSSEERRALAAVPDDLPALMRSLGFAEADRVGDSLQEAIQFPSLNVRGLSSAWVGGDARTIVPATATAAIDVRLVAETPVDEMFAKVHDFIAGARLVHSGSGPDRRRAAGTSASSSSDRSSGTNAFGLRSTIRSRRGLSVASPKSGERSRSGNGRAEGRCRSRLSWRRWAFRR